MNILNQAIKSYRDKNYARALELFEKAGAQYGSKMVEANIHLCKKALAKATPDKILPVGQHKTDQPSVHVAREPALDPATRYMLARMGELTLSHEEMSKLLKEHKQLTNKKSADAEVKPVKPVPADWPKDLVLAPLPDSTNDFRWNLSRKRKHSIPNESRPGLSIIVPTFNRSHILDVTLACLSNQETRYPFEVIVADDGSKEPIDNVVRRYESVLDIKYVRQKDYGYQLCAVRNLGLRTAKYEFVAILDCDMAPNPKWVESYMDLLAQDDDVALIGPRKYVDTSSHSAEAFRADKQLIERLPEVKTNNNVAGKDQATISVDWRLEHFQKTDDLRLCDTPFRFFSGGNVPFARKWLNRVGWFDEEFTHWGGEDNEFGYRLYRHGCFFRAVAGGMAYHQEPPGKENETDRAEGKKITINIVREKVPYFYRKTTPLESSVIHKRPLVSIYIPAYNCADSIVRCVSSALNQTVVDLEVCICNDGSTDNTLEILTQNFGQNPRVKVEDHPNGGIGKASNRAVRMTQGFYIGQLDSDDYLEPDAVELCLREFMVNRKLACVYTTNRNVNPDGSLIANGYNWPTYSREKLTTAMIAHHFRMFTSRAWHLSDGFDEMITNAVDYDMYLKLSEIGPFHHINKISYNRVLHGENTSIKKIGIQKLNHFLVVNNSLKRQNSLSYSYTPQDLDNDNSRKYVFEKAPEKPGIINIPGRSRASTTPSHGKLYHWVSIGENCLPDDILKRHKKKSFSTPFSSGRSNIDYVNQLEDASYKGLLDPKTLAYEDAWGKRVVRSRTIRNCDDIFDLSCSRGFEFTHHDPIGNAADTASYERKISRLHTLRKKENFVFLYFHRKNPKSDISSIIAKLRKFQEHYASESAEIIVALFYQEIASLDNRGVITTTHPNKLLEFTFNTTHKWEGSDPATFWARNDDDLISKMIEDICHFAATKELRLI